MSKVILVIGKVLNYLVPILNYTDLEFLLTSEFLTIPSELGFSQNPSSGSLK